MLNANYQLRHTMNNFNKTIKHRPNYDRDNTNVKKCKCKAVLKKGPESVDQCNIIT